MRVLAIDPGPHVGLAYWTNGGAPATYAWMETPEHLYRCLSAWVETADVVVIEDFFIGGSRGREANETIEMIGAVAYVCRKKGIELVRQRPGAGKFATTEKLKRAGWWVVGESDHARSARKHLMLYLANQGLLSAEVLLPSGP